MRKVRIFIILALVFSFVFAFGGCSVEEETTNVFESLVKIEEGIFSPQKADFLTPSADVIKANKLDAAEYEAPDGRIINTVEIKGFSNEVMEIYNFADDMLVYMEYIVNFDETMDEDGFEEVRNTLYDMAVEYMTMPSIIYVDGVDYEPEFDATAFEPIKEGDGLDWHDKDGNMVQILFFTPDKYQNSYGVHLSVSVTKGSLFEEHE
ncbi:MAG: hypothetical protein IJO96_06755 [Oscillospiraceae bacterium]|nr:hypothetical protein [Oscillospiraceae bacterium]